jgi:hypothetical protein
MAFALQPPIGRQTKRAHHIGNACRRKCSIIRAWGRSTGDQMRVEGFSSKATLSGFAKKRTLQLMLKALKHRVVEMRHHLLAFAQP